MLAVPLTISGEGPCRVEAAVEFELEVPPEDKIDELDLMLDEAFEWLV